MKATVGGKRGKKAYAEHKYTGALLDESKERCVH